MADKISRYILEIGGDASELTRVFGTVKGEFAAAAADLKRQSDRLDLFAAITDNVPKVQAALDKARASVKSFSDQIDQIKAAGGIAPKALTDGLAQAERAAAAASKEFARQQQQLATLGSQLKAAGVDTTNLAAAQNKLAEASKTAATAAEVAAAKQQLGLVTLKDTEAQAAKLKAAFETLKASGVLSANETVVAQQRLSAELKALNETVTKTGNGVKQMGSDLKAGFTAAGGSALAAVGGVTAVTAALTSAISAAKEYRQVMAEASSGTDLTKESTAALGREAQNLAQELGLNVNESIRSLFGLLKAGVPEDNVVDVLRISSEAAKASLSDVGTGVKVAKLFLNDLKIPTDQLGHAFDVLKVTVGGSKEGFETFAASAGPLLAIAKATGTGLDTLGVVLRAMTKNGLEAGDAMAALEKIMLQLGSPAGREGLLKLGISTTNLGEVIAQLGERGAKLQQVLDLTGLSKKQAGAVAALLNDTSRIAEGLKRVENAGGAVTKTNAKLYDTPKEISDRFHATLDVTKEKLGELAGTGGRATTAITALLGRFNILIDDAARFSEAQNAQQIAIDRATLSWLGFGDAERKAAVELDAYAKKEAAAAEATAEHTVKIEEQRAKLQTLGDALLKQAESVRAEAIAELKAAEDTATRQIQLIELAANARKRKSDADLAADEQLRVSAGVLFELGQREITVIQNVAKAREDGALSAKQAVDKILQVQQQSASDELAIIADKTKKIRDLEETAIAAKVKAAGSSAIDLKKLAEDELTIRAKSTSDIVSIYQQLYDKLYKQAREGQDKVNSVDAERISFEEQITLKLRGLRQEGISDAEAYAQKLRDIDQLTSKAKRALDEGDFKLGKQYTDQAIATAESLTKVINSEGVTIVSGFQVQQEKLTRIKGAADQYTKALKEQGDAAHEGADKAKDELETVGVVLDTLKSRLKELRDNISEKLTQNIDITLNGVEQAQGIIKELTKPEQKVITVVTVRPGETAPDQTVLPPLGLNRGGFARHFASGGSVFNVPRWSKVPGSGNSDTVPAALPVGAFVMRKAAALKYGDGIMSQLARGYAQGGFVSDLIFGNIPGKKKTEVQKVAEYVNSLPPAAQDQFKADIEAGGTAALIAQNEALEAIATQERGPAKAIAPEDVSPLPSPQDAIGYGRYVESLLRFGNVFDLVKRGLGDYIKQIEQTPTPFLIQSLIRTARAAASNAYLQDFHTGTGFGAQTPGKTPQLLDWYDFIAQAGQSGRPGRVRRFASGGLADTVPAMLTPGEWVIPPNVARMLGGGFLEAMNAGRLNFAPPPMPRHFATGGPVPGARIPERGTVGLGGNTFHVNINTPFPADDDRTLRRLQAGLDKITARTGRRIVQR